MIWWEFEFGILLLWELLKQDDIIADVGLILNDDVSLMLSLFDEGLRHSSGKFLIYMLKL
jgi:hypothetical protein